MSANLLNFLNPFLTTGIATLVLLHYFLDPKHHLKTIQILLFWFLASAVFFFIPYLPQTLNIPFVYFIVQGILVYLLLVNYWKVKSRQALRLTAIFVLINAAGILLLGFLLNGIV